MVELVKENLLHIGPVLLVGLIGILIIIERLVSLFIRFPIINQKYFFEKIRELVLANKVLEAISVCEGYSSKPVARIVKEALMRAHQPEALIDNGLEISVNEAIQEVSARTPYLATIANVATLIGLLGTIIGLMHAFEAIGSANAQQKASLLAAGISTAMNATMIGLAVAIPCMICFSFLMAKTNRLIGDIEQAAVRISDFILQHYFDAESSADVRRR
jgi:biopolymer transport protein ExbB